MPDSRSTAFGNRDMRMRLSNRSASFVRQREMSTRAAFAQDEYLVSDVHGGIVRLRHSRGNGVNVNRWPLCY